MCVSQISATFQILLSCNFLRFTPYINSLHRSFLRFTLPVVSHGHMTMKPRVAAGDEDGLVDIECRTLSVGEVERAGS